MFGGVGLNTLTKKFLDSYGLPYSCRDDYFTSLDRLGREKVDVQIGPHIEDNNLLDKCARLGEADSKVENDNPFVNPEAWPAFLNVCRERLRRLIDEGN